MILPDKIYVHVGPHLGLLNTTIIKTDVPEEQEYIRKDALLEWANSWLAFKWSGVVLDDGFSYAMEELIKKLNEI